MEPEQYDLPMGLHTTTLYALCPDGAVRLGVLDLDAVRTNKDGVCERLTPLIGPEAVMAAKEQARVQVAESEATWNLTNPRTISDQERERLVTGAAGQILADKIRQAGVLTDLNPD